MDHWVQGIAIKDKKDGKKKTRLPETPKTAEEMWQQSVIGDYLAKYRVRMKQDAQLNTAKLVHWGACRAKVDTIVIKRHQTPDHQLLGMM